MIGMKLDGGWARSGRQLRMLQSRFAPAIDKSVAQEAQAARKQIVEGIRGQAPAGQRFVPLSKLTVAIRKARGFRGTKALVRSGALVGSVAVKRQGRGRYFVGVLRGGQSRTGAPITTIARINEEGATFVVRVTPRMLRFLMANLRKSGAARAGTRGGGTLKNKFLVVRIPPRPFIGPVIDAINRDRQGTKQRMLARMAKELGYTFER